MAEFTLAPWYVSGSADGLVYGGPKHRLIVPNAAEPFPRGWNGAEDVANRVLIAAAPEMWAALVLAEQYLRHPDIQAMPFALPASAAHERVCAALAKANGPFK